MSLNWSLPYWSAPLLLLAAAGAFLWTVWVYDRTRPSPGGLWRTVLISLRAIVLLLLLLALARPFLTRLALRDTPAELVLVVEDSGSMAIRDCPLSADPADTALTSRWAQALAIVEDLTDAATSGPEPVTVAAWAGNGLAPLRDFAALEAAGQIPAGHGTDLASLLGQVRTRLVGRPARAVVLISDGQETTGRMENNPGMSRGGGRAGAAVPDFMTDLFVVGVGDVQGPPDRVLMDLRYPDLAFQGDEVVVEAGVLHRYTGARDLAPATIRLTDQDGSLLAEKTVPPSTDLTRVELSFRPRQAGLQIFHLELAPLDNERFLANNQASLALNVRQERARALLLAAQPSWDARFLAQAVLRESRLDLATVYATTRGLVFADSLSPWLEPRTISEWLAWDAVILTGWQAPLDLDWQLLGQAVQEGLGVLVLPGPQAAGEEGQAFTAPDPRLQEWLPVRAQAWQWSTGSYFLEMTDEGAPHSILSGLAKGQPVGSGGLALADLPPLRRLALTQAKPGALTLLSARADGVESESLGPVLVVDSRGQGRVAWVGARRLWELAFWELPGENLNRAESLEQAGRSLLRNLLVWTASGEDDAGLALVGHGTIYQEGETIKLAAKWRDMRGQPVGDRNLSLELHPVGAGADTATYRTFRLQPTPGSAGLAETTLPPLPPGSYSVQLVGEGSPPVKGRLENLYVTDHSVEKTQIRLNERRLLQIAGRTGGSYYRAEQPDQIEELRRRLQNLDWAGQKRPVRSRSELLAGWPFFGLVIILLSLEWLLRRRKNLL